MPASRQGCRRLLARWLSAKDSLAILFSYRRDKCQWKRQACQLQVQRLSREPVALRLLLRRVVAHRLQRLAQVVMALKLLALDDRI